MRIKTKNPTTYENIMAFIENFARLELVGRGPLNKNGVDFGPNRVERSRNLLRDQSVGNGLFLGGLLDLLCEQWPKFLVFWDRTIRKSTLFPSHQIAIEVEGVRISRHGRRRVCE